VPSASAVGLTARDVTVSYGHTDVVHGADLRLAAGRVTALIGPNGSGKSTLLRAIARLHRPRGGSIELDDGTDALTLGRTEFAQTVTVLSQGRPTPGGLSVRDVVQFGRYPYRRRFRAGDEDGSRIVEQAMAITGIREFCDRGIEQLSGGQLQRVWLASCLAQDTGILLLDEPTTYLDLRYQVEILDLIRELADRHGVTVGVVLHDLDQAAALADHVVLLSSGRIVAAGTPAEVYDAELLTRTYGIRIDVDTDASTGAMRTRALGSYQFRHERVPAPL
jgi:ferric hydroxamate transport system ATP-binding protein